MAKWTQEKIDMAKQAAKSKEWKVGDRFHCLGLNMRCEQIVTTGQIVKLYAIPDDRGVSPHTGHRTIYNCDIKHGRLTMPANTGDLF